MDLPDLEPKYDTFAYKGKTYYLHEASAGAAARYTNARRKALIVAHDEVVGFKEGVGDVEAILVAGCTFEDERCDRPVGLATIQGWPHKLVNRLFAACLDLCPELTKGAKTVAELKAEVEALQKQLADAKAETSDPKG